MNICYDLIDSLGYTTENRYITVLSVSDNDDETYYVIDTINREIVESFNTEIEANDYIFATNTEIAFSGTGYLNL